MPSLFSPKPIVMRWFWKIPRDSPRRLLAAQEPPKSRAGRRSVANSAGQRAGARARIPIEDKFSQGRGGYGLARIAVPRADISGAWIRAFFLVMNLITLERLFFGLCFCSATRSEATRSASRPCQHKLIPSAPPCYTTCGHYFLSGHYLYRRRGPPVPIASRNRYHPGCP